MNSQLSSDILKALNGLGYHEATEVQAQVIPTILNQRRSNGSIKNGKWENSILWNSSL